MRWKFFVFVAVLMTLSLMSFASANFEIGNQSHWIQENYKEGQNVSGWINISFDSEPVSSLFTDSFGNSISLGRVLNNSKNIEFNFSCDNGVCLDGFSEEGSFTSKSFSLGAGEERVVGFKFTGNIQAIQSAEFQISSNAQSSCTGQLEIDLGNDEIIDFGNNKNSGVLCGTEDKSCYTESENPSEISLTYNPYCQVFNLSSSPGFSAGLWIRESVSGSREVNIALYDRYGIEQKSCKLNEAQIDGTGKYVYCDLNYFVPEEGEYYLCAYSGNTGTAEYKTKGYSSSNSSKACGFNDFPSASKAKTAAYAFSIKPKKFDSFGTLNVNQSSVIEGFSNIIENYLDDKYNFDCAQGCYFPVKLKSNVAQNITIKNLELIYDEVGLVGKEDTTFYELGEEGYRISSDFGKLYLYGLEVEKEYNNYKIYFKGEKILEEDIEIGDFGVDFELADYDKAIEGFNTGFLVDPFVGGSIKEYRLVVEGEEIRSLTPYIYYRFDEAKNYSVVFEVETISGEVYSESATIEVYPIETEFGKLIDAEKEKIGKIDNKLIVLDSDIKEKILEGFNLDLERNKLNIIESEYDLATTKDEYLALVSDFESLEIPSDIKTDYSTPSMFFVNEYHVETKALNSQPAEPGTEKDLIDYILYWNLDNLNSEYSFEDYSLIDEENTNINFVRVVSLSIKERKAFSENYYLYLKANSGFEILGNVSEEENGYYIVDLAKNRNVRISADSEIEIEELPAFIAPDVSELVFSAGNVEEYDKSKNWIIMILLFIILIFVGLVVYYFLGKWYDEKYEKKLFPNRNDVFNLINYIARSKKNGVPEGKIRKNLQNSKWSSEQIRFILRKYLGKNTGMYAFFRRKVKIERRIAKEEDREMKLQRKMEQAASKRYFVKERAIWKVIVFSIITFGIYAFVWLFKTSKELRAFNKKAPSKKLLWSVVLLIILEFFMILGIWISIWMSIGSENFGATGILTIIAVLIGIVSAITSIIIYWKYSVAHESLTGFSQIGLFILMLLVSPAGMIVSQVYLNRVAKKLQKT